MKSSGYNADYSIESLKELDRFLKEENKPNGILSKNVGQKLFALGAYLGDVFIKHISYRYMFFNTLYKNINIYFKSVYGLDFGGE